jgi:hypothetical protein
MLRYLGIANILFITIGLRSLASSDSGYSFLKHPISDIAKNKKNRAKYIALFCVFTILQILFAIVIIYYLNLPANRLLDALFFGGGLVLLLSAVTTYYYPKLHRWLVWLAVILISAGILLASRFLFRNFASLTTLLVIATVVLTLSTQYLRIVRKAGYWEVPLLILVALWNLIASIMIFTRSI